MFRKKRDSLMVKGRSQSLAWPATTACSSSSLPAVASHCGKGKFIHRKVGKLLQARWTPAMPSLRMVAIATDLARMMSMPITSPASILVQ